MRSSLGIQGVSDEVAIGWGGFGVVYRATERDHNRTVAVKVLPADLNELARDRFDRERKAMGALSGHPNIVTVYRSGFAESGQPFIVMEYMQGGSAADALAGGGPMPWSEVVDIGVALADAVESAHQAGVLHRDIKPANVLLGGHGEPKLADFGIARVAGSSETRTTNVTASLAHAAPEIIDGASPTARADVYSLASTLYELMAGRAAFADPEDESIVPMLTRIAQADVPDLGANGVPPPLSAVVERAMAKDPTERYSTAAAFGAALALAASESESVASAVDTRRTTKVAAPPPPPINRAESPVAASEPSDSRSVRWPVVAAGASVLAVLLLVVLLVVILREDRGVSAATLPEPTGADYPSYAQVSDPRNVITLEVPSSWTDIDDGVDDGEPFLAVSPDVDGLDTYGVPGVVIDVTVEPLTDVEALLADAVDAGCVNQGTATFRDGRLDGRFLELVDCGEENATIWQIAAAPGDGAFTALVRIQAVEDRDQTAAHRILDTLVIEGS